MSNKKNQSTKPAIKIKPTIVRNEQRTALKNDLMNLSYIINNRINDIIPYVETVHIDRINRKKHCNGLIFDILNEKPYGFLHFCLNKVTVSCVYLEKRAISDVHVYNLLCELLSLPKNDFKGKIRDGKVYTEITKPGFDSLLKEFDKIKGRHVRPSVPEIV